jgi:hypothetical protein
MILSALSGQAATRIREKVPVFPFSVRLILKQRAELNRSQIGTAALPGGTRVGLSYTGVTDPETIARYTRLGFRTSVAVTPGTPTKTLQALEKAGADLTLGHGGTASEMGLTPQEAFDGAAARRLNLLRRAQGPCAIAGYYSMRVRWELPIDRRLGRYLYAIHDSNYLACNSWAEGYSILVGRNRTPEQIVRPHNHNRVGRVPNTLVYYQTVANILRGLVEMTEPGGVTTIGLRKFDPKDQRKVERYIGRYGKDPRIWHTTQHEICGYAYLKEKSRILGVDRVSDTELQVRLAVEQDTCMPFCPAPLTLKLPADFPVASARLGSTDCPVMRNKRGAFLDVPVREAFRSTCSMTLERPPSMTIPEDMPVTLVLRNLSDRPLENARLVWSSNVGTDVLCEETGPFTLEAKAERRVRATVRTDRGPRRGVRPKGARFGLVPISAFLSGSVGGEPRFSMESWEIVVAPRLRVEMDPRSVPIPKGRSQPVFIHLANGRVDRDPAWGDVHFEKLIDHRTGACKGTVRFELPEGMEAVPSRRPFELPENGHATLRFEIRNTTWGDDKPVYVRPAVRFAGEAEPIEVPWYGTAVMRDRRSETGPLNKEGLLAQASWDDPKNTRANLDFAAGSSRQSCPGATGGGSTPSHEGVRKWCLGWNSNVAFDSWKNIDHRRGTVMFWVRRDPRVRNDIRTRPDPDKSWQVPGTHKNYGEKLFCVGPHRDLILRRYPRHHQREGYLELVLREMPVRGRKTRVHYVQVPYDTERLYEWHHVAILWDLAARRLELYLDGARAGRAEPGGGEWLVQPFDRGRKTMNVVLVETHHGHWSGSMRDELYVYNRPLTAAEIRRNMTLVRQGKAGDLLPARDREAEAK